MEIWGKGLDILDSFLISPWKHPQVGTGSWRTCRWQGPPRLFQVRSCIPRRGPSRCSSSTRRRLRGSGSSCWSQGFLEGATQLLYTGQNIVQTKVSAASETELSKRKFDLPSFWILKVFCFHWPEWPFGPRGKNQMCQMTFCLQGHVFKINAGLLVMAKFLNTNQPDTQKEQQIWILYYTSSLPRVQWNSFYISD